MRHLSVDEGRTVHMENKSILSYTYPLYAFWRTCNSNTKFFKTKTIDRIQTILETLTSLHDGNDAQTIKTGSLYRVFVICFRAVTDLMFYCRFPSRRLHVQYKTLPVSYKVLDLKWAIYHKMLVGTRKGGRSKETTLEKCASHKTAQS